MRVGRGPYLLSVLALAAVYVAAGRLGLALDAVSGFATLVWAPSGIALAALLLGGHRLWPGVAAGAFFVNLWTGAAIPLAAGIAIGNTLAAVAGAYAIRRLPRFDASLSRSRDVIGLIILGAALSTLVSATIGTTSLRLAGVVTPERFRVTWVAWWMGDAIGVAIVAPLVLTWSGFRIAHVPRRRFGEAVLLGLGMVAAAMLVFGPTTRSGAADFVLPYMLSPVMIWAALRFMQRGATATTFIVAVIAIGGTALDLGPFTGGPLHERLGALQAFLAIMAVTFLVLGAVAAERAASERELRIATGAAEAASRAKSRFLAVVSHELRTPLNGITGYSDLLLADVAGPLNERQNLYVTRIRAAAWHLVGIIDGILTFSRGDALRHELRLELVDASSLVHDTVALLAPHVAARSLDVRLALPDEPVHMHTDPGKVRQILVNLLGNAVKFTDGGSLELGYHCDDGWLTFRVRDFGPGIPADQLERIFEPFTQLGGNGAQLPAGTGLGLPVSRTLAELLGGSITVHSRVGDGSTFIVRLPAVTAPPTAARV